MSRYIILTIIFLFNCGANAAQWIISSSNGTQSASVPVTVTLTGDGQTRDGDLTIIFDESRLSLPVASGVIPGAGQNGANCLRSASNKVFVARLGGSLLPNTPTILCNLPFTVLNPAPSGNATLTGTSAGCYTNVSVSTTCSVVNGAVAVTGTAPPTPVAVTGDVFKYLFVLLSNEAGAPTAAQVTGFDFASTAPRPLTGLNVGDPLFAAGVIPVPATGDFAAYLAQYPNTARAKLERYILIQYRTSTDLVAAKSSLASDPYVVAVYEPNKTELLNGSSGNPKEAVQVHSKSLFDQYHLNVLKMPEAWTYAGGWGLVGIADNGLYINHPDLKSFSGPGSVGGSFIPGGNFLSKYALDLGNYPISIDFNVDELEPVVASGVTPEDATACDLADGVQDNLMIPSFAGHGTNVSGIAVSNANSADGILGVCKNCGLSMMKITQTRCINASTPFVAISFGPESTSGAVTILSQIGAQAINVSFRIATTPAAPITDFCAAQPNYVFCLALQFAKENEVIVSVASGNDRGRLDFPARAASTAGVGGIDATLATWDESPGSTNSCPTGSNSQCGTNFTLFSGEKKQEIVTAAKAVRATMYPGVDWNVGLGCGDSVGGGSATDGVGVCTGTSMAAPQATAIYALLRSINPLLLAGDPETAAFGIRDIVTTTTDRAQAGLPWTAQLGYGIPDAAAAARKVLGTVRNSIAKNRATPLFALYGATTKDYAVMATPQNAMSLIRYAAAAYSTVPSAGNFVGGATIPGYTEFPHEVTTPSPEPRARAYVLTTEFAPVIDQNRILTPLYLLDRERNWPLNCTPLSPPPGGCNKLNRDFILLTSINQMNNAVVAGYAYRGLQGYVFTTQAIGTQAMYLKCKTSDDDCAIFLENERTEFESAGYTSTFPSSSSTIIGYAYPTGDSDGDGLVDAMEYAVGTNPNSSDSDGDGVGDSIEMPMNGVSNSDPCSGPNITCLAPAPLIFANGFE